LPGLSALHDEIPALIATVPDPVHNALFLCTGNSARSIFAEVLINRWGTGHIQGFSAGSHPKGEVHPLALELLRSKGLPTEGLRSKSWDEFAKPGAPNLDFVVTVCDNAAGEVCPYWPGTPITAHWGVSDPAAVDGTLATRRRAFLSAFSTLEARIKLLSSLPLRTLDNIHLQARLEEIGKIPAPSDDAR
jgi:protein-tyrosine-phosphatase